jgi:hypothetical protein
LEYGPRGRWGADMDEGRTSEACRIGELVTGFVDRLGPVHGRYDSVAQAWENLLPGALRAHCRVGGLTNGCLKILADGSSYLYELQLCRAPLLEELQRLCPSAKIRRIDVAMMR